VKSVVHARQRPEGMRFRIWNHVSNTYLTRELSRDELCARLLDEYTPAETHAGDVRTDIEERIERTERRGTSLSMTKAVPVDAPWETESCPVCRWQHHAFVMSDHRACALCGEAAERPWHDESCGQDPERPRHSPPVTLPADEAPRGPRCEYCAGNGLVRSESGHRSTCAICDGHGVTLKQVSDLLAQVLHAVTKLARTP